METISSKACAYYPALFEEIEKYASSLDEIRYLSLMDKEAFLSGLVTGIKKIPRVLTRTTKRFVRRGKKFFRNLFGWETAKPSTPAEVAKAQAETAKAKAKATRAKRQIAKKQQDITSAIEQAQQGGGFMQNMNPMLAAGLGAGLVGLPGVAIAASTIKDDAEARARRAALAAGGAGFVGGLLSSRFLNNLANRYSATYGPPPMYGPYYGPYYGQY